MAKDEEGKHHHVKFASRYALSHFKTLDAYAALSRAENMIDDAKKIQDLAVECVEKGINFPENVWSYEILNYYAVSFVTCLEWHARSRLVDLMLYDPTQIGPNDIKGLDSKALSQMMSEAITVPYLVGAATAVPSIDRYVKIFVRVFAALGISIHPQKLLKEKIFEREIMGMIYSAPLYDVMDVMFGDRHELVHEIGPAVLAHRSMREMWDLDKVIHMGQGTVDCIKLMEQQISKTAPSNFPNLLNSEFTPQNEREVVEKEIADLENKISTYMKESSIEMTSEWDAALKAQREYDSAEQSFLLESEFLRPVRHADSSDAVYLEFLKQRRAYLKLLVAQLPPPWADMPETSGENIWQEKRTPVDAS